MNKPNIFGFPYFEKPPPYQHFLKHLMPLFPWKSIAAPGPLRGFQFPARSAGMTEPRAGSWIVVPIYVMTVPRTQVVMMVRSSP